MWHQELTQDEYEYKYPRQDGQPDQPGVLMMTDKGHQANYTGSQTAKNQEDAIKGKHVLLPPGIGGHCHEDKRIDDEHENKNGSQTNCPSSRLRVGGFP